MDKADAIDDIQRVARELGKAPTVSEYREHGAYSVEGVANYFDGSFVTAREAAGVADGELSPNSREDLLNDIQRVADRVDGEPSKDEYKQHGEYALSGITYRFESWIGAKQAAGVYDSSNHNPTKKQLLADMQRVDSDESGALSQVKYNQHGEWTSRTAQRRFGDWETACQEAGVTRPDNGPQPVQDAALVEDILRVSEQLSHVPSRSEYHEHGNFSRQMAIERFGSWPDAVNAAGLDALDPGGLPGERNPHWADIEPYYGPHWDKRAATIRERDGYACANCGMSNRTHKEKYGTKLNVHHIEKARTFEDYELANAPENLITLCNSCHSEYEHLPNQRAKKLLEG